MKVLKILALGLDTSCILFQKKAN